MLKSNNLSVSDKANVGSKGQRTVGSAGQQSVERSDSASSSLLRNSQSLSLFLKTVNEVELKSSISSNLSASSDIKREKYKNKSYSSRISFDSVNSSLLLPDLVAYLVS